MSSNGGTVLVTGAGGFVGIALVAEMLRRGYSVNAASRRVSAKARDSGSQLRTIQVASVGSRTDWRTSLNAAGPARFAPVDCVIHCAAVSGLRTYNAAPEELRDVNVLGTVALARQAAELGARRFVFVSSVKVNGESTEEGALLSPSSKVAPSDAYALSKWKAEMELGELAAKTGLEVVVVRPPVVYGVGAKGNIARLIRLVRAGVPLPFGMIKNRRSMIFVDNLVDLLVLCTSHSCASGRVLFASDGDDVSTPRLISLVAAAAGVPARLLPVPMLLLRGLGALLGRSPDINRLVLSLRVDITLTQSVLDWRPRFCVAEGIRQTVGSS